MAKNGRLRRKLHEALDEMFNKLPEANNMEMELITRDADIYYGETVEVSEAGVRSNCSFKLDATEQCSECGALIALDEDEEDD